MYFCDQKLIRKSQIWEYFLKKHYFNKKVEDNFCENNWKLAKSLETQGILEKIQVTGCLSLVHPPKSVQKRPTKSKQYDKKICLTQIYHSL